LTLDETGTYTHVMAYPLRLIRTSAVLFLALGVLAGAQVPQKIAYVSVTDKAGNPVPAVAPSDFVVREDKMAREVLDVALADEPMQLAILVDNSSAADPFIRDFREALTAFVTDVTADVPTKGRHQIAIIGLASRPTIIRDYTADTAQLVKAAQGIFALPGTGPYLLDAIMETSNGILKRTTARPVFVALVTNGGPELSDRTYDVVLRSLKTSGAALHVVEVGRSELGPHDREVVIGEGTKTSGGRNEEVFVGSALTAKMKQIAQDLTHQYRVTYRKSDRLVQPETLTVTVKKPDLVVRSTPAREEPPARK
jgi:hypothetical protein